MKKQIKALALTILIAATTACGAEEAKVDSTPIAQDQAAVTKVNKVASIKAPKTSNIEKEEVKSNYLIPQTVGLADEDVAEVKEEIKDEEETLVAYEIEETVVETVVEEVAEEISEVEEVAEEASEEAYEFVEEIIEEDEEELVAEEFAAAEEEVAINFEESLAETSTNESIDLANKVEEEVSSPEAIVVEETPAEEIEEIEEITEEIVEEAEELEEVEEAEETEEVEEAGLTVASPSAAEIRAYWTNHVSKAANKANFYGLDLVNQNDIYDLAPVANVNNIDLGQISKAAQEDALHIANTVRYASGLNEIALGADQTAYAQAATMVNRLNLTISHNPEMPTGLDSKTYGQGVHGAANSNLAASFGLLDSVVAYLRDDIGAINQQEVGHRRWILNPNATVVGFGQTDEFNAMFVNNDDYAGQNKDQVVAYPGQTAISEFHSDNSSLSLQFGESFDITNASVTVTDLETGEVSTDSHIDQSFKGNGYAITFGNGMSHTPGTKLQVKVAGVTKNGVDYPVEYTIEYMSIAQ